MGYSEHYKDTTKNEIEYLVTDELIFGLRSIGFNSENINFKYILEWLHKKYDYKINVSKINNKDHLFYSNYYYYTIVKNNMDELSISNYYDDTSGNIDYEQYINAIFKIIETIQKQYYGTENNTIKS